MALSLKRSLFFTISFLSALIRLAGCGPFAHGAEPDTLFYSDRFVFLGKNIDEPLLVVTDFRRGKNGPKYYGEFFGAIFFKNKWTFLEGNDLYPYRPGDLETIQPSYFAKVTGSSVSGFKIRYDAGDFTFTLSSGVPQSFYPPTEGKALQKKSGVSEAVLSVRGKEVWGQMVHETLSWDGFSGLKQYKGLFKEYQAFYLTTQRERKIYFYQNKSDLKAFQNQYHFTESPPSEGGIILSENSSASLFKTPLKIIPLKNISPPFAFYSIPQRWQVEAPATELFFLWSRDHASKNWFWGGYYLMAVEGVLKEGSTEERVWGLAEYIP